MKNLIKSITGIIFFLMIQPDHAAAFCGIGGIVTPPAQSCYCSSNKVAIKLMSGNVCQDERCVSQGQAQHFLNNGWIYGCCSSARIGIENQSEANNMKTFPNPVSSLVTTSFELNHAQHVILTLFDMNGRAVFVLADNYYDSGRNEIAWNVSDLNEGVYNLQIRADDFLKTERLIVSK